MNALQLFSDKYLEQSRQATPEQVLEYLESFRLMNSKKTTSKLISIKIPQPLLDSFRQRCEFEGIRYQSQIKVLMTHWLKNR